MTLEEIEEVERCLDRLQELLAEYIDSETLQKMKDIPAYLRVLRKAEKRNGEVE